MSGNRGQAKKAGAWQLQARRPGLGARVQAVCGRSADSHNACGCLRVSTQKVPDIGQDSKGTFGESWELGHLFEDLNDDSFPSLTGKTTGIPIHVFGTETHMTAIVGMALGHRPIPNQPPTAAHTANFLLNASGSTSVGAGRPPP